MATGVLLIDPYNDFLHAEGKANGAVVQSQTEENTNEHLSEVLAVAREYKFPVFYCLHQQTHEHSLLGWKYPTGSQLMLQQRKVFETGSWGAEIFEGMQPVMENGDVVVSKHWNSSSFHNTDLNYQLLQKGIRNVVVVGLIAETCMESTARDAVEHGYNVTILRDATAAFSSEAKQIAQKLIWPRVANQVLTVKEWSDKLN